MKITKLEFAGYINEFKFKELFIHLGWDNARTALNPILINDVFLTPRVIADKSGFKIIECQSDGIPSHTIRVQVANIIRKVFNEHLLIFHDTRKTEQVWLYCYNHNSQNKKAIIRFVAGQDVERLYQRASGMIFELDEQDNITIVDVKARVQGNFAANAEKVTKRFYDAFKKHHTMFLEFIEGIHTKVDKEWYASIMLNRLMFCYFIQRRGFLNRDKNYLRTKLNELKEKHGKGKFYSFYRNFLRVLFHKGLGTHIHSPEIRDMIGEIPYLNGGIFDIHDLEKEYPDIDISDEAFENIFNLFDKYEWHLDTRECATGNEINPDVLGFIFEKYINDRNAMGAYYTKEDITGYISRSTVLPWLLENAKKACPYAFAPNGAVWSFLENSGDAYIFDSVKKGVDIPLPEHIKVGVDNAAPRLIHRRKCWNEPAPGEYALPTEIWREVVERRARYDEVKGLIVSGNITEVSDLITYNLDIISFVIDLVDTIEDPVFIKAFYEGLESITILDPTCGSGAFLFAAMNILRPLYDRCLSRMEDYLVHNHKVSLDKEVRWYFEEKLDLIESGHRPSRQYFIYKSIILNNLYGVDIMREAVETAKLRLFLKLVSTVIPDYFRENIGIEPLPDIDFNLKAGNTLIGYASEQEIDEALTGNIYSMQMRSEIKDAMYQMAKATSRFKQLQLGFGDYDSDDFRQAKVDLVKRQAALKKTLDITLHKSVYEGVSEDDWDNNHMPFHWVSDFYSIIVENGGFDVIIGNPPYIETKNVEYAINGYRTLSCGNLYAYIMERSKHVCNSGGFISMIIPLSGHSTKRMKPLIEFFYNEFTLKYLFNISADANPSVLFHGVKFRLAIFNVSNVTTGFHSTKYQRWYAEERELLFDRVHFSVHKKENYLEVVGKTPSPVLSGILEKINSKRLFFYQAQHGSTYRCYYHNTPVNWIRSHSFTPYFLSERDGEAVSTQLKEISFNTEKEMKTGSAILNSSLFFIWWLVNSDCYHLNRKEIQYFRFTADRKDIIYELSRLSDELANDYLMKSRRRVYNYATSGRVEYDEFYPKKSKTIIDQIDAILALHYGFTEEELDYIINYDIKYRMGVGANDVTEAA